MAVTQDACELTSWDRALGRGMFHTDADNLMHRVRRRIHWWRLGHAESIVVADGYDGSFDPKTRIRITVERDCDGLD